MSARAVLVGRVSTEHATQETSLERQRAELEELAKRRAWTVVGWYEDRSSGSKVASREGLGRALDELYRGRADILVVHDLDRLGRNVREMLETVDALAAAGKGFFVRDQEIDGTGAMGRLVFTILCAVAEFYRRDAKRKIRGALARRRRSGLPMGRPRHTDWTKLPRVLELRAAAVPWSKIPKLVKTGTKASWSNLVSKIQKQPCPAFDATIPDAAGRRCVLYASHGLKHLDRAGRWFDAPTASLDHAVS